MKYKKHSFVGINDKNVKIRCFVVLNIYMLFFVTILLRLVVAKDYTIGDFPEYFINKDHLEVIIVLGKNAKALDVISAIDIAAKLQYYQDTMKLIPLRTLALLDDEIDSVKNQNTIVIGGPCINSAAAELFGYPIDCRANIHPGEAVIKLFKQATGFYSLFIGGYSAEDTRRAAEVIKNNEKYNLNTTTVKIYSKSLPGLIIQS